MVILHLNGTPQAQVEAIPITRVRSDRVWALLGYLAWRRGEWVTREELSLRLWPDVPSKTARHRLRQTLQYVKASFRESPLEATSHSLRLSGLVLVDVSTQGIGPDFLDGLRDDWIQDARPPAAASGWMALIEGEEERHRSDKVLAEVKGLSEPELDEYLKGQLSVWLMSGKLAGPITSLHELRCSGHLSATGMLALVEMHLTRGETDSGLQLLRDRLVVDAPGSLRLWRNYLEGVHAHRLGWEAEARRAYAAVVSGAERSAPSLRLQAQFMMGFLPPVHQNPGQLSKLAQDGVKRAQVHRDRFRELGFCLLLAIADLRLGDTRSAKKRLEELHLAYSQSGRPGQTASLLGRVGRLYQELGDEGEADRCFALALSQARQIDNPRVLAEALTFVADRHIEKEEYPDAMLLHLEALALRRQGQGAWAVATSLRGAGVAGLHQDLWHQSEPLLIEALSLYEGFQNDLGVASILFPIAQLSRRLGRPGRARKCAAAALQILDRFPPEVHTLEVPSFYATRADVQKFLEAQC